jgi:cytosine/adenosine deaminase-related metal-dependent hydrolase
VHFVDSQTLRARIVYPVDAPPIDGGCVTIADGGIVSVGTAASVDGNPIDLGDVALLPGFVNAHTHLEFSDLAEPLGTVGMPFVDWIRLAISERNRRSHRPARAIGTGCRESLRAGVTTVGEIVTADARPYTLATPAPELTLFREVIGFSRARVDSALRAACDQLGELRKVSETHAGTELGVSPHAPYTVSPQLVGQLVELATAQNAPLAMHLAESREEIELLRDANGPFRELLEERSMWDPAVISRGSRPLDYLRQLAASPWALVVHGNYLDDEERGFLAAHHDRMSLVHCPRTHAYFGHERFPLADLLARGVRVVLGTDSRASNPDLSLLAEMQSVAAHHTDVAPQAVLKLSTLDAAEALGRANSVGTITVGKTANLVALPLPAGASGDADELLSTIFASAESPSHVWLHGTAIDVPR